MANEPSPIKRQSPSDLRIMIKTVNGNIDGKFYTYRCEKEKSNLIKIFLQKE